jgi:hypothetical protein
MKDNNPRKNLGMQGKAEIRFGACSLWGWFEMGITIHYCLGARDGNAVERALDLAELMARRWGMKVERKAPKWVVAGSRNTGIESELGAILGGGECS